MPDALLVIDVQNGFINPFTKHVPDRISRLIERERHKTVLFSRFVNIEGSPFRRMLDWDACAEPPDTEIVPASAGFAAEDQINSKPGYAGLPDNLAGRLQRDGIERIAVVGIDTDKYVLKVALDLFDLNTGAGHLRDAGFGGGHMAASPDEQ